MSLKNKENGFKNKFSNKRKGSAIIIKLGIYKQLCYTRNE